MESGHTNMLWSPRKVSSTKKCANATSGENLEHDNNQASGNLTIAPFNRETHQPINSRPVEEKERQEGDVTGLHPQDSSLYIWNIRDYIASLSPKVDILCLQKHKLKGDKVEKNIRTLWKSDKFWSLEANPSNEVEDRIIGARRGNIALCFHSIIQPLFLNKGSLAGNKAQWNKYTEPEGGYLGILNIYAYNMVGERCTMWNEVFQSLPIECRWIMTRDFNMVESPLNISTTPCSWLMGLKEELGWVDIKKQVQY